MTWLHIFVLANKRGKEALTCPAASWNGTENVYVSTFLSTPK